MIEKDEYLKYDIPEIIKLPKKSVPYVKNAIENIRVIPPDKVSKFSTLLFMAVGFINNVNEYNSMLRSQDANDIQGHIGEYLKSIKSDADEEDILYPFDKEHELIEAIVDGDKQRASGLLNDLLGYIFFSSAGNFEIIRARVFELTVLLSRAAVDGGADPNQIFGMNYTYIRQINQLSSIDQLCIWLSEVMNKFTDYVFRFSDVKHIDVIRKAVDYIRKNHQNKISLEEVANHVYLSPSYFSKIFKDEMNCNFNAYLNAVRVEKSKQLLILDKISLIDIAGTVGFEDQSYFSKVFKKMTGVTPGKYRELRGKIRPLVDESGPNAIIN